MIRSVINGHNLRKASREVLSNKGSAGIDGLSVDELSGYLDIPREAMLFGIEGTSEKDETTRKEQLAAFEKQREQIVQAVLTGTYQPQAILGVEIPKEGYRHIVDIDLKTFFDEVDHCILLQLLYRKIKCPLTMRLIRKWLRAPIKINGKLTKRRKGVPQGSPLSPLLSNVMLHELDKELEKRGLRYVRYCDDFSIYTQSRISARKTGNEIYLFLRNKLKLPINREKSGIRKPVNFEILGFKFVSTYVKGISGQYQRWHRIKAGNGSKQT